MDWNETFLIGEMLADDATRRHMAEDHAQQIQRLREETRILVQQANRRAEAAESQAARLQEALEAVKREAQGAIAQVRSQLDGVATSYGTVLHAIGGQPAYAAAGRDGIATVYLTASAVRLTSLEQFISLLADHLGAWPDHTAGILLAGWGEDGMDVLERTAPAPGSEIVDDLGETLVEAIGIGEEVMVVPLVMLSAGDAALAANGCVPAVLAMPHGLPLLVPLPGEGVTVETLAMAIRSFTG